jgi:hypothetical protein
MAGLLTPRPGMKRLSTAPSDADNASLLVSNAGVTPCRDRAFWKRLYEDADLMVFAKLLRPLVRGQSVQLMPAAPWGPHPRAMPATRE